MYILFLALRNFANAIVNISKNILENSIQIAPIMRLYNSRLAAGLSILTSLAFQINSHAIPNQGSPGFLDVVTRSLGHLGLFRRDCKQIVTEFEEDCSSIAQRCGISTADLGKYNPQIDLRNLPLIPSRLPVCCSPGDLPFALPVNDDKGNCATYVSLDNDTCASIAGKFQIPMSYIEKINKAAEWGWAGCDNFIVNQPMCLSNGTGLDSTPLPDEGDSNYTSPAYSNSPYNTLEDIDAAMNGIDPDCLYQYMVEVLQKNLTDSLSTYNDVMANHYDNKFNTFAGAVVKSAPKQVHDFMLNHSNEYFTCEVTEMQWCCDDPQKSCNPTQCRYCYPGKCDMVDIMGRPVRRDSGGPSIVRCIPLLLLYFLSGRIIWKSSSGLGSPILAASL
jgi:hypothetical protein